ncbi:hypothetical protein ENSA5_61970 [Enhygromyxa salina]|uniref:Uncharacterized protein n=1 Tax=Enhygromyxa salina TaxID=215803 RepID=A0A2S9XD30_9BACT|nr:hypothetical protein [Enhygromyxa salina]PRP90763.1 hypothetical protein ENSA5_61970 [Enhygromyxa salina]
MTMLLSACKPSPCSDDSVDLPPHLAELPVLDEDASVCIATTPRPKEETAMLMRWGESIAPVQTELMVEMDAAGWGQQSCGPAGMEIAIDPDKVCFGKGEEFMSASFVLGHSKQLGIEKSAITTHLTWYGGS